MIKLSILIPTLPNRTHFLNEMVTNIKRQLSNISNPEEVQIVVDPRDKSISTGEKRNNLISAAQGKYVWQVDDDDFISGSSIELLLKAFETDADVIGINGWMTTDGSKRVDWEIRLGHEYKAIKKNGKDYYLRFPNHITPMKKEHAQKIKFQDISWQEDYKWALEMRESGLLKTQEIITHPIYHYRHRSVK